MNQFVLGLTFRMGQHSDGQHRLTRISSLLLAVSFFVPMISWGFETAAYVNNLSQLSINQQPIAIPKKHGKIVSSYQGQSHSLVIHVQDLHCHYEVQKNIAAILQYFDKHHQLKLITVEGSAHSINTDKIRTFPIKQIREEVSDYFVKQGKLP